MPRQEPVIDVVAGKRSAFCSAMLTIVTTGLVVFVVIGFATHAGSPNNCGLAEIKQLNATCLREQWENHHKRWQAEFAFDIAGGVASATAIPPILVLNDIFRAHGQGSHVMTPAFIMSSGIRILELTFRAGVGMHSDWVASSWGTPDGNNVPHLSDQDLRALSISYATTMSQGLWLFAMDYLLLGVGLIAASLCAYKCDKALPRWWAHLGIFAGVLGVINFLLELGRLGSWFLMSEISGVTVGLMGFLLLPIWLFVLGCTLERASRSAGQRLMAGDEGSSLELPNTA